MTENYIPPKYEQTAFNCPYCGVYAIQVWKKIDLSVFLENQKLKDPKVSRCRHCGNDAFWMEGNLLVPSEKTGPMPNPDLPIELSSIFEEARSIVEVSPLAASTMLRFVLRALLQNPENRENGFVEDLEGLSDEILESLKVLNIIGSNAVAPGKIDVADDHEVALSLFDIVNLIAQEKISNMKKLMEIYRRLPESRRKSFEAQNSSSDQGM